MALTPERRRELEAEFGPPANQVQQQSSAERLEYLRSLAGEPETKDPLISLLATGYFTTLFLGALLAAYITYKIIRLLIKAYRKIDKALD